MRIGMRDVTAQDSERLFAWRNSDAVRRYMFTSRPIARDEHDRWFAQIQSDHSRRYWIITVEGEDVGLANIYDLDRANSRCMWASYLASESVRGRGVGSYVEYRVLEYAFDVLGLEKLWSYVLTSNERAVGMHLRHGFCQEGVLRRHVWREDGPVDVAIISMLREEWTAKRESFRARLLSRGIDLEP